MVVLSLLPPLMSEVGCGRRCAHNNLVLRRESLQTCYIGNVYATLRISGQSSTHTNSEGSTGPNLITTPVRLVLKLFSMIVLTIFDSRRLPGSTRTKLSASSPAGFRIY